MSDLEKKYNFEFLVFEILAGQNEYQIAKNTGIPVKKIRAITESEKFQLLYNEVLETIKKRIADKMEIVYDKAINRLSQILDDADTSKVLEACKIIFNSKMAKTPLTAIQINTSKGDKISFTEQPSLTELIIQKRRERGLKEPEIIENKENKEV